MDQHDDDAVAPRALTRRELREAAARAGSAPAAGPGPTPVPPVLPPEAHVDDVRWDAPITEAVAGPVPGGAVAGASDDDTQAFEPVHVAEPGEPQATGGSDDDAERGPDAEPDAEAEPGPDAEPDAEAEPEPDAEREPTAEPDPAAAEPQPAPASEPGRPLRVSALAVPPPEPDLAPPLGAPAWFPVAHDDAPRAASPGRPAAPRDTAEPDTAEPDTAAPETEAPDPAEPHAATAAPASTAATPAPTSPVGDGVLPTLTDLLAARPVPPEGPAELGWQGLVRRLTGGLVSPPPGPAERARRTAVASVRRSLDGPRTIVVINPKGGAHKTTATLLLAATFGQHRGGYTLAWDNNETRGTLGWRSHPAGHHNTAVDLLRDLGRLADPGAARVGDLDGYVRSQGAGRFDVLASDEDAASAASIDAEAFRALHGTLSRFYRVMVVDTGNNMRASNWQAAIEAADQVVIVSTVREDTAQSAAWAVDALRATGHEDVVRRAVTVLSAPAPQRDDALAARLHAHFGALTRVVLDVPYDPSLVGGTPLDVDALARPTREAWLRVSAAVAEGL